MTVTRAFRAGVVGLLTLGGCEKGPATAEPTATSAVDADPLDEAATLLLDALQRGDYDRLAGETSEPLTHDLSRAEFDDLAAIVQWLGEVQSRAVEDHDATYGGGQRWYALQFERGAGLTLEVSIDEGGKLVGFEFAGKGFEEAERGVLAEPWREFKVYDFHLLDAELQPLADGEPVLGTRVEYEIVVGGIEALLGEHHLSVEKTVVDAAGKEVFREPIEFDTKFSQDALGVPRGTVRGFVEVPGPGSWTMELRITDENAHRDIEHTQPFETK